MRVAEKIYKQMVIRGMNQQRLARESQVSDSEVSRILNGKSSPSLEYAHRLAQALGVSLDYLADDSMEADESAEGRLQAAEDREILELARTVGYRQSRRVLEVTLELGYEVGMRRLLGVEARPVIESAPPAGSTVRKKSVGRANSA